MKDSYKLTRQVHGGEGGGTYFRQREYMVWFSLEAHHTETTTVNLPPSCVYFSFSTKQVYFDPEI